MFVFILAWLFQFSDEEEVCVYIYIQQCLSISLYIYTLGIAAIVLGSLEGPLYIDYLKDLISQGLWVQKTPNDRFFGEL